MNDIFKGLAYIEAELLALKQSSLDRYDNKEIINGSYVSGYLFACSDLRNIITRKCLKWLLEKNGGLCFHCDNPLEEKAITIDHLVPLNRGGVDNIDNLVPSHGQCNWDKSNNMPSEEQILKLKRIKENE